MSDFVQTMKDWRRMCQQMDKTFGMDGCDHCPLEVCMAVYESDNSENYVEIERKVAKWAAEHPEPVYPTWWKYMCMIGVIPDTLGDKTLGEVTINNLMSMSIPPDIAVKLGIEPVPVVHVDCGAMNEADARKKLGVEPKGADKD